MELNEVKQRAAEPEKNEPQNVEYRTAEYRRMESLRSVFLMRKDPFQLI
jgi:hypothetical protein